MPSPRDLPFLVQLLEDPSPVVRQGLTEAFQSYGPELASMLDALPVTPNTLQRSRIRELLQEKMRQTLRNSWPAWYALEEDSARLEAALSQIACYLQPVPDQPVLGDLLDELAAAYRDWEARQHIYGDALDLARFLFEEKGLRGAHNDYHAPENSNLVQVIQSGTGLPISLSCIYLLVGHRLHMSVGGCNWPGHFLALTYARNELYVVDCFNGGTAVSEADFLKKQGPSRQAAASLLHHEAGAEVIVQRVLANLANSYKRQQDAANQLLMADLLEIHERMTEGATHG